MQPWLPQPKEWRDLTVEAESGSADSMLALYRTALRIRRAEPTLGDGQMTWLPSPDGVLDFDRGGSVRWGGSVRSMVNLSDGPVDIPAHTAAILASGPVSGDLLPPDTAIWLRMKAQSQPSASSACLPLR